MIHTPRAAVLAALAALVATASGVPAVSAASRSPAARFAAAGASAATSATNPRPSEGAAAAAPRTDGATPDTSVTTIVLVRHAERDDRFVGSDPPLNGEGHARAGALAHVLQDFGISSIYVTEFTRTRETAEPLAKLLGDSLRVLLGQDFATQAARIVRENRGRAALVVGHSNTVPQLIEALMGAKVAFGHDAFDPIYVVVLYPGGSKLLRLNYGEASPRP